uniref:Tectonic-1-3 N-terminal domain-containing protein n=1 Tax=Timema shepardi TaxID=629360 RepID=A0A7R9B145_TIMSH|nr:unnamed protein product [Timema shepardi]
MDELARYPSSETHKVAALAVDEKSVRVLSSLPDSKSWEPLVGVEVQPVCDDHHVGREIMLIQVAVGVAGPWFADYQGPENAVHLLEAFTQKTHITDLKIRTLNEDSRPQCVIGLQEESVITDVGGSSFHTGPGASEVSLLNLPFSLRERFILVLPVVVRLQVLEQGVLLGLVTRLYQHLRLQLLMEKLTWASPSQISPVVQWKISLKMWCKTNQQLAKPVTHPGWQGEGEEKWGSYHLRPLNKRNRHCENSTCLVAFVFMVTKTLRRLHRYPSRPFGQIYTGSRFLCVVCDFPVHPINWSLATVKGSSPRERAYFHPAYSEVASSPCDLTENFCDVSCCSDQDCSKDQKSSFTCSIKKQNTDMGNITEEETLPVSFSGNPGYEVSRPLVVVMNNSLENDTSTVWKQGMVGIWSKGGICMIRPESLPESYSVHHTAVPFIIPSGVIDDFVVAIDVSFFVTVVEDGVRV